MNGTFIYEDYLSLYNNNRIKSLHFIKSQIQPSSIDLSLSEECYEIKTSFLSPDRKVKDTELHGLSSDLHYRLTSDLCCNWNLPEC